MLLPLNPAGAVAGSAAVLRSRIFIRLIVEVGIFEAPNIATFDWRRSTVKGPSNEVSAPSTSLIDFDSSALNSTDPVVAQNWLSVIVTPRESVTLAGDAARADGKNIP